MARFLYLLLISLLPVSVSGCAPGTGSLGTKGTFEYDLIPPILYTYSSNDISHGQISAEYATRVLTSDLQNAIDEVLLANSIPSNDVSPPVTTFTPPDVDIIDGSACTESTSILYLLYNNVVYYKCENSKKTVFSVALKVQITAVQAIYESQWEALADQVADKLTTKRNAQFNGPTIVTVT
ncbi:unnamed protein product [Caenorhabditis sp. 36 PRJEB53466]|nr:unnamed protein product [Caenorhabditis sp. 36 PRJEB53466]